MKTKNMRVYCPYCGAKFTHEKEVTDTILTCKRCALQVTASINNKKIQIEVMEEKPMLANTS